MNDIESRADIERLVDGFYKKVIIDKVIGHIFTQVIELKWDSHIPIMYNFWETTLLGAIKYKGNVMLKHMELNKKVTLEPKHFDRWIILWEQTVFELFEGKKALEAVSRAKQIAALMKFKIIQTD